MTSEASTPPAPPNFNIGSGDVFFPDILAPLQESVPILKFGGQGGLSDLFGVAIFWPTPVAEIVVAIVFWATVFRDVGRHSSLNLLLLLFFGEQSFL